MSIAQKIEHTLLKASSSETDILKLCDEAKKHAFYAVCVPPNWTKVAHRSLLSSSSKLVSVVGYPFGFSTRHCKTEEAKELVDLGVNEVDMVINLSAVVESRETDAIEEIEAVMRVIGNCPLKVIIECPLLSPTEIRRASSYVSKSGAAFIKTATGTLPEGAKRKDIQLIREEVGSLIGIKASGGIKTHQQALELLEAGATRLGCSSSVQIIREEKEVEKSA